MEGNKPNAPTSHGAADGRGLPSSPPEPTSSGFRISLRNSPGLVPPPDLRTATSKPVLPEITLPREITPGVIKNLMKQLAEEAEHTERGGSRPPRQHSPEQFAKAIEEAVTKAGITSKHRQELQSEVEEERKKTEEERRKNLADDKTKRPLGSRLIY